MTKLIKYTAHVHDQTLSKTQEYREWRAEERRNTDLQESEQIQTRRDNEKCSSSSQQHGEQSFLSSQNTRNAEVDSHTS